MKKLKIRYLRLVNFLSFGPEGVEIYFDDFGQIVLVKGTNLDTGTDRNPASNGVGKSAIQDGLAFAFYGKPVRRPKKIDHSDVVNMKTGGGLVVEVQFDDYRIVRSREKSTNKLELWKSPHHLWDKTTKVTKGKGIQEQIDEAVGLSHTAFCNVVVFDDSNAYSFLELDAAGKREVVENLLGLDRFRAYHESAKDMVKKQKTTIKDLTKDYEHLTTSVADTSGRIKKIQQQEESWKESEKGKVTALKNRLKERVSALAQCDNSAALSEYNASQEKAEALGATIAQAQGKKSKLILIIQDAEKRLATMDEGSEDLFAIVRKHRGDIERHEATILEAKKKIAELNNLTDGAKCPTCHGGISQANYGAVLKHEENVYKTAIIQKGNEETKLVLAEDKLNTRKAGLAKMRESLAEAKTKLSLLDQRILSDTREMNKLSALPKPEVGEKERAIEAEILAIKKQIGEKQAGIDGESPYKEILDSAISERDGKIVESETKGKDLEEAEYRLKYYEFWVEAFGDKGIRKQVVDGIIPALNSRVAYWLQFLIDSKIQLTFDNQLTETIVRNGVEAYYHTMSNGEKRRINLAVSQAFAYVMMLNSGHCPSVVFLDEITGGGIDTNGVTGIYNMIFELAKERQVFVTTHNQALLHMLQGCESINLVKKDDVTTLVS